MKATESESGVDSGVDSSKDLYKKEVVLDSIEVMQELQNSRVPLIFDLLLFSCSVLHSEVARGHLCGRQSSPFSSGQGRNRKNKQR